MRKFPHDRRQRKQRPKRTLTLMVEALEPRLVLSAVGFGFDGARRQFNFHPRDHETSDVYRSAFADQNHDERRHRPFERGRHGNHLSDRPPLRFEPFVKAEGEAPSARYEFVDEIPARAPHTNTTNPSMTLLVVALTPTAASLRGGDLLTFGQLSARSSQSPQASPVRSEATPSRSDAASGLAMSDAARSTVPGLATFVSLTTNDSASWWNADRKSFETVFESTRRLDEFVRPTAARERQVDSSRDTTQERALRLSEDLLWAGVSEGGFIDIDSVADENSRERFDFTDDSEDISLSKRFSKQLRQDEFWFDFGNTRFDLLLDSADVQDLAQEQTLDNAKAEEEAWLREDGGMIVLTSSQFTDQVAGAVIDDATRSPTSDSAEREIDIPMDAGIGVFQAIEVATTPVEQRGEVHAKGGSVAPIKGKTTAGNEVVAPPVEQAAQSSEGDQPEPIRAAAMPLLLAVSAFLQRSREERTKVTDRQREV